MLSCMLAELMHEAHLEIPSYFKVLIVKIPCGVALHLLLTPEIKQGLAIMKYSNNQQHLFVANGSQISFMIGSIQYFTGLYCQIINIYLLTFQHTVEHSIIHFVALEMIMELPKMYFEAL
jgi:hypothetical protein